MKKCMKKLFSWIGITASISLIAGITSFFIIKKTVWITLKRDEKGK